MKILFILPAIGQKENEKYIGTWKMEPLTIATLKALTPNYVETQFFDDRIDKIDYNTPADLVVISVETYTAQRAYKIADKFRQKGAKVVMGGYHTKAVPDEALEHADCVILGGAETVWELMIEDFKKDELKQTYAGALEFSNKLPDRSIYKDKKYLPISLIETGRGCPNTCEFCSISSFYCQEYIPRKIEDIVAEIKQVKHKFIFFTDDNICAQKGHLEEICKAITPLKVAWSSQAALSVAQDENLLKTMKNSGCQTILIGFESLDKRNLDQMNKSWNYKLGEVEELIGKIHKVGIGIYATFVFGFDFDEPEMFKKTVDFSLKHKFFFAAFNHLLPFPDTPFYERLKNENRILFEKWWLKKDYKYGDIPYQSLKIEPEKLKDFCADARRKFFSPKNILLRGIAQFKRNKNLFLLLVFFTQNFNLMREIDKKLNLPVGSGLDESEKK